MSDRCPTCDRPTAYDERGVYRNALYYADGACAGGTGSSDCEANRVDWRARFQAERELCQSINRSFDVARAERDRLRAFVEHVSTWAPHWRDDKAIDKLIEQAQRVLRGEDR